MKNPTLRIKKKTRLKELRRFKIDIKEIVHDCLLDIESYIVDDIMNYLKKREILYVKKNSQKNKKAKKR